MDGWKNAFGSAPHKRTQKVAQTAGRVTEASSSLRQVHAVSVQAAQAATDMLGGVEQVERATAEMDAAMTGFVRRVKAL